MVEDTIRLAFSLTGVAWRAIWPGCAVLVLPGAGALGRETRSETSRNSGVVQNKRKARLDAKRGTSDQPGQPGQSAPAGVLIRGGLTGGSVCRVGRADPLFNRYRAEDGFTNAGVSLAIVAYDLPTLAALLVLGQLSNHLGRRPTSIASLGLLSAPRRGRGVPGHLGNRGLLPGLRARTGGRSTPHPQHAHPRTGVRRLYGSQRSGRSLGGRFTPAAAQRLGMIMFLAGMIGIITAIATGTLVLFITATIVAGAGQGIAISAATRGLLHGSTVADRAPIFSAIYLICYSAAAFPTRLRSTFQQLSRYRR